MNDAILSTNSPITNATPAGGVPGAPNAGTANKVAPVMTPVLQTPVTPSKTAESVKNVITATPAKQDVSNITAKTNEITQGMQNQAVLPKTTFNPDVSVVDYLASTGKPSDFASRAVMAKNAGIQNYTGTAQQNQQLIASLKNVPPAKPEVKPVEKAQQQALDAANGKVPPTPEEIAKQKNDSIIGIYEQGVTNPNDILSHLNGQDITINDVNNAIAGASELSKFKSGQNAKVNDLITANEDLKTKLGQLANGTFPLTDSEQAQIKSINDKFDQIKDDQITANKNYEGATTIAGIASGRNRYTPEIEAGNLASAVNVGIRKIADIESQRVDAVNKLKQAIEDNDYKLITATYDAVNKLADAKGTALNDIYTATDNAATKAEAAKKQAADDLYNRVTKPIQDISIEAAKNFAPPEIISDINSAKTVSDAIAASKGYLQTATGTLGDYLQYKGEKEGKGYVPMSYEDYKDRQDQKAINMEYNKAYASAAGKAASDAKNGTSDKVQQALEQQGRQVIAKEFSARTGALGVENAKVNQANHINALIKQYYDPKTGNYNVPKSQYGELILGLANLVSPTSVASDSLREDINQKTAVGDFNGALSYVTNSPQNGNSQEMIKNLIDSVDRQAETAVRNRQAALDNMSDLLPTDLEQSRKDALLKATNMVGYEGDDRVSANKVNDYLSTNGDTKLSTPIHLSTPIKLPSGKTITDLYTIRDQAGAYMAQPGSTEQGLLQELKDRGLITE